MRCPIPIAVLVLASLPATARAQYGYPYGAGYQARAATAGESYLRGSADLVSAAGYASLQNSMAAQGYAQARSMEMDNRLKYADTYFEKRRINEEYKATKNRRMSSEALFRVNQAQKPKPLSSTELDPLTGDIHWPVVFQQDQFVDDCAALEGVFAKKARQEHVSFDDYQQVEELGQRMRDALDKLIKELRPDDYISAKNFLESLMYEARLATT